MALVAAIIPSVSAFVISSLYCFLNNVPFYKKNSTKSILHKILINIRNLFIGIFATNLLYNPYSISFFPLHEELFRMLLYSLSIEFAFYWSHRFLHSNHFIYMNIHREHHLERDPFPIDAYILSPIESCIITASFSFPNIIGIKLTQRGVIVVQTAHLVLGILVHGAFVSIKHHMHHHKYIKGNYSGIYPLWDYVFNTRI